MRSRAPLLRSTVLVAGILAPPPEARAEGVSLDPQLVEMSLSADALPGVDSPRVDGAGDTRVGFLALGSWRPVVLYEEDGTADVAVTWRADAQVGVSRDWSRRLSTRVIFPSAIQDAGEVAMLDAGGYGMGDLRVGARYEISATRPFYASVRADIRAPLGTKAAYMGEEATRLEAGFLLRAELPVIVDLDVAYCARPTLDTGFDLALGPEAVVDAGLARSFGARGPTVGIALASRVGARTTAGDGSGWRAEALGQVRLPLGDHLLADLGLGRGITRGYGTTSARAYAGLTWRNRAPQATPVPSVVASPMDAVITPPATVIETPEAPPEIPWKEGQLARVERTQVQIREPIQFEFGTSHILPESRPVLEAVADILGRHWQIDHLVIEGHASEEGSFAYNDDLSVSRARAVYVALVEAGISPRRLSYRGSGEVLPVDLALPGGAGSLTEAALAKNRRVEFHILVLLDALTLPPKDADPIVLSWSGQTVPLRKGKEELLFGPDEPILRKEEVPTARSFQRELLDEESSDLPAAPPSPPPLPEEAP